jgi:hypothetical protein
MEQQMLCEVGNHPFVLSGGDIAAYAKFGFAPLPICFPHQHQWRLAFRNDRFLHRRKCDLTGADIVSMYPQDAPYKVYEREAWHSDRWDPLSYGREFDFNRPFFEQYAQLQREVPRMALVNIGSINSDFCNSCVYNKNSYLIFGGDRNEDSMFGALPMYCRSCLDCDWTTRCELCYFCAYSENCYLCQFVFSSKECSESAFLEDCIGCSNCILSFNLRNKSYYIENKPYSKEEYLKKKKELLDGSFATQQKLLHRFLDLREKRAVKYAHIINCENVSGDIIFHSKNCQNCYECIGCEDCSQAWTVFTSKDCFNCDYIGLDSSLNYNNLSTDKAYKTSMSYFTVSSSDIEYCELVLSSKNLFGCIGLKHQEYCILNKKYSKDEFESLRNRIIEHMKRTRAHGASAQASEIGTSGPQSSEAELKNQAWGRFFPKQLSTFPYNESTASVFFPRTKEHAKMEGFRWSDSQTHLTRQTYKIPDNINDVKDDILDASLACEKTSKNFRIIPQELDFYRKNLIPIPRRHPDTRYYNRLALRNPFELFDRACANCRASIKTTYAQNRPESPCCEKCYLAFIY